MRSCCPNQCADALRRGRATEGGLLRRSEKKWADRFEFHQFNITAEPEKLKVLVAKCDCVVNLAAICNPSEYIKQPVNTIRSNYNDAQVRGVCSAARRGLMLCGRLHSLSRQQLSLAWGEPGLAG